MPFIGPLEDRISIREFQESFADVINRKARDVWLEFWTDDAVWVTGGLTAKGKEEILNQWDKFYSPFNTTRNNETRFYKAMPAALTIDDDKALGRSYIEVLILYAGTVEPEELFSSIMFFTNPLHRIVLMKLFLKVLLKVNDRQVFTLAGLKLRTPPRRPWEKTACRFSRAISK